MADKERLKNIMRRMRQTRPNETICLAFWEVDLILKHIDNLQEENRKSKRIDVVTVPPWRKHEE